MAASGMAAAAMRCVGNRIKATSEHFRAAAPGILKASPPSQVVKASPPRQVLKAAAPQGLRFAHLLKLLKSQGFFSTTFRAASSKSLDKAASSKSIDKGLLNGQLQCYMKPQSALFQANLAKRHGMSLGVKSRGFSSGPFEENFIKKLIKELFYNNRAVLSKYWKQLDSSTKSVIIQTCLNWTLFVGSATLLHGYGWFKDLYDEFKGLFITAAQERAKAQEDLKVHVTEEYKKLHTMISEAIKISTKSQDDRLKALEDDVFVYKVMSYFAMLKLFPTRPIKWNQLEQLKPVFLDPFLASLAELEAKDKFQQ